MRGVILSFLCVLMRRTTLVNGPPKKNQSLKIFLGGENFALFSKTLTGSVRSNLCRSVRMRGVN